MFYQKWVYKVVVDVIDSNGNVVTATLDGTDSGTDSGAGSSVAQTTYTITVKDTIVGHNVNITWISKELPKQEHQPLLL